MRALDWQVYDLSQGYVGVKVFATEMELNWASIVGVTLALASAVVGAATAFLSLFIDRKLVSHKEQILNHIDERFALKELMEEKFKHLTEKVSNIERELETVAKRNDK